MKGLTHFMNENVADSKFSVGDRVKFTIDGDTIEDQIDNMDDNYIYTVDSYKFDIDTLEFVEEDGEVFPSVKLQKA